MAATTLRLTPQRSTTMADLEMAAAWDFTQSMGGLRPDGHQNEIARWQVLLRQRGVDGAAHAGHGHGLGTQVRAVDGVARAALMLLAMEPPMRPRPTIPTFIPYSSMALTASCSL